MAHPKQGDKSQEVKTLQERLIKLFGKSILPKYGADGGFGKETTEAIKHAQYIGRLPVTGVVDDLTSEFINSDPPSNPVETASNKGKSLFTSTRALKTYGTPGNAATQGRYMETWDVPEDIQRAFGHVFFSAVGTKGFPKRIFINKDFRPQLEKALRNLIDRGFATELKTWDGCYQLRNKVSNAASFSMHAWGLAVDLNAAENGYNRSVSLSNGFIKCFTDCHIISGAFWNVRDGMHFELAG